MGKILSLLLFIYASACWANQDPTAPLDWQQTDTPTQAATVPIVDQLPQLQSIVCSSTEPCKAVLNGMVVMIGEQINGYQVKKIEPQRVVLSQAGKQWNLSLFSLDIRQ